MVIGQRSGFLDAFRTEIYSVLPAWAKAMFFGQPSARPLIFDAQAKTIVQKRGKIHVPTALLDSEAPDLVAFKRQNVDVVLSDRDLLRRDISVPVKSLSKLDKIVTLDTVQKTPFKPTDIYFTAQILSKGGHNAKVAQWIARRDNIGALRARLAGLGLHVRHVYVEANPGAVLADFSPEIAPRAGAWRKLNTLLALTAFGLLCGWFLAPSWAALQALEEQEAVNVSLGQEALALRQSVEALQGDASERAAFMARVSRRQTVSIILRDLTVLMPDAVWLTDVSIQNGRIIVRGSTTGSAADLVLSLTRDQRFASPRLTGPVSQDTDGRERFDMTLDLKDEGL